MSSIFETSIFSATISDTELGLLQRFSTSFIVSFDLWTSDAVSDIEMELCDVHLMECRPFYWISNSHLDMRASVIFFRGPEIIDASGLCISLVTEILNSESSFYLTALNSSSLPSPDKRLPSKSCSVSLPTDYSSDNFSLTGGKFSYWSAIESIKFPSERVRFKFEFVLEPAKGLSGYDFGERLYLVLSF